MTDSVVDLVEEHVDLGWFSIFWINCRTLVLCACCTTECGSPGILKSMSVFILSRSVSSSMLSVSASWYIWGSSCTATVLVTGRPLLSWVCSTLRLLLISDGRGWISSVSTSRPVPSEELRSSFKEFTLISWKRDVFLSSCISSGRLHLSRIGFGVSWVDWINLVCRTTSPSGCRTVSPSGCWTTFEPNSFVHSWRDEIFGGGRGDMYAFSNETSPVFNLTTFGIQEVFLEGWLHSIVSDRMSILSELQDWCRPNIPRLDVSSKRYAGIVHDAVHSSQSFQDPSDFCL